MSTKSFRYKAFISYKHSIDSKKAEKISQSIKRYGKSRFSVRTENIFIDELSLPKGIPLSEIFNELKESEYLILLASPESANSSWVREELDFWCNHLGRSDKLIIILTNGYILPKNENKLHIDWTKTTSLPKELKSSIIEIPYFVNLKWVNENENEFELSLANNRFEKEIRGVVARLRGVSPNQVYDEAITVAKKDKLIKQIGTYSIISLSILSIGLSILFNNKRLEAEKRKSEVEVLAELYEKQRDTTVISLSKEKASRLRAEIAEDIANLQKDSIVLLLQTAKEAKQNEVKQRKLAQKERDKAKLSLSKEYLEKAKFCLENFEYEKSEQFANKAIAEDEKNKGALGVLWKLRTGHLIEHKWGFSPNILGAHTTICEDKGILVFYDVYKNYFLLYNILLDSLQKINTNNKIYSLAVSPSGNLITTIDNESLIKTWCTESKSLIRVFKSEINTQNASYNLKLEINDNGNVFLLNNKRNQKNTVIAEAWNAMNSKKSLSFQSNDSIVSFMRIGHSVQIAIIHRKDNSHVITIFNLEDLKKEYQIDNFLKNLSQKFGNWPSEQNPIVCCPKNKVFTTWDYENKTINLWGLLSNKNIGSYLGFGKPTFNNKGDLIVFQNDSEIESSKFIISIVSIHNDTSKLSQEIEIPNSLREIIVFNEFAIKYNECTFTFSKDDNRLAIGDLHGNLYIFEKSKGLYKIIKQFSFKKDTPINNLFFFNNSNILFIYSQSHISYNYHKNEKAHYSSNSNLVCFDISSNQVVLDLKNDASIKDKWSDYYPLYLDNKILITLDRSEAKCNLWDISNLIRQWYFELDKSLTDNLDEIYFTEENNLVLFQNGLAKFINSNNGAMIRSVNSYTLHQDTVDIEKIIKRSSNKLLKYSYNSKYDIFAYSDYKNNFYVSCINGTQEILNFSVDGFITEILISPNGKYIAIKLLDNRIKLLNLKMIF